MKSRYGVSIVTLALVLSSALLLGGCASLFGKKTGAERRVATSEAMELVEVEIRNTAVQINATNASLAAVINPSQTDNTKAIGVFSKKAEVMEDAAENYLKLTDKMNAEGDNFFKEWRREGNEYQDPKIRALSDAKRRELRTLYDQIRQSSIGGREGVTQYISSIKQINTYFSTDTSPKGVEAITPIANRAILDGAALVTASDKILESIGKVRAELDAN